MTAAAVLWPTKDEYDVAIAGWTETIWDPDLRSGILSCDNMGICRFGGANLYVCIYKIGNWMVRCFCSKSSSSPPADIRGRYIAIDRFCRTNAGRVSALLPVTYLEYGITVGTRTLPIVKMPFLAGCPSLGEFIMDHYQDRAMMQLLSAAWLRMMRELETAQMAHGDLDLSNVLVEQHDTNLTLKIIDYDSIWIPELAGRNQTEYGHTNFQHPNFLPPRQRPYNAEMDRFSALVIYISLKTLVSHPNLYEDWGADESDRLLLSEADYLNAGLVDSRIAQLRKLSSPDMLSFLDELNMSLRDQRMPRSLGEIAFLAQFMLKLPSSQPVQPSRPSIAPAPAVSIWKDAVYSMNTVFIDPPLPPVQLWDSMEADRLPMPPVPLRRPQEVYQPVDGEVNKVQISSEEPMVSEGKRRRLIIIALCLLVLIILVMSIILAAILSTNHHITDGALPNATLQGPAHAISGRTIITAYILCGRPF
jgi:hypothetical protein